MIVHTIWLHLPTGTAIHCAGSHSDEIRRDPARFGVSRVDPSLPVIDWPAVDAAIRNGWARIQLTDKGRHAVRVLDRPALAVAVAWMRRQPQWTGMVTLTFNTLDGLTGTFTDEEIYRADWICA